MPRDPSPDHYTPCALRSMEQYRRRRANDRSPASRNDVLHQLSNSISLQETRISNLMRSFDIDLKSSENWTGIDGEIGSESSDPLNAFGTSRPSPSSSTNSLRRAISHPPPLSRSGRLSPTTIQRILSPNSSIFSEVSSGADTSYDSGLYQWLGIKNSSPGSKKSLDSSIISKEPLEMSNSNPDMSILSSQSAYSQPSPLSSPSNRILLPLSPPATVRPPFTESLSKEEPEPALGFAPDLNVAPTPSPQLLSKDAEEEADRVFLHDSTLPLLLKNISLQHYMPSATVLRHFQRVVDELRGLYVPNDERNNVPKWTQCSKASRRQTIMSTRSLPGSCHHSPPPPSSPRNLSAHVPEVMLPFKGPRVQDRESRATRELYTEMAVMLFGQAAEAEAQVKDLRFLADRFNNLARMKRGVALIVGVRGRERA